MISWYSDIHVDIWVKQCHVYQPWLGIVKIPPLKMVMTGAWFSIVLPTVTWVYGRDIWELQIFLNELSLASPWPCGLTFGDVGLRNLGIRYSRSICREKLKLNWTITGSSWTKMKKSVFWWTKFFWGGGWSCAWWINLGLDLFGYPMEGTVKGAIGVSKNERGSMLS